MEIQIQLAEEIDVAVTVRATVVTELWRTWADIALIQLELARNARASNDSYAELHAAMLTIVAAATSIDGFATIVVEFGTNPDRPTDEKSDPPSRAHHIGAILRDNFKLGAKTNLWSQDLKELWKLRSGEVGGLLHPKNVLDGPTYHPTAAGEVSVVRSLYRLESAEWAVELMRDIYATCGASAVKPGHAKLEQKLQDLTRELDRLAAGESRQRTQPHHDDLR